MSNEFGKPGHKNACDLNPETCTDRLLEVADFIEKYYSKFAMNVVMNGAYRPSPTGNFELVPFDEWLHDCGTSACIQGWIEILSREPGQKLTKNWREIADSLNMNADCFDAMCYPNGHSPQGNCYINIKDGRIGAAFLRKVVETKRVDWSFVDDLVDKPVDNFILQPGGDDVLPS